MKKKRTAALLLLALLLCNFSMQAFASDNALEDAIIEPTSSNDSEAPEGWNGATEADYDKNDAFPVQALDEPSEITPYATSSGEWIYSSNGKWWYRYSDGSYPSNGWAYINGYWYHFDSNGWMDTGWITDNGKTYYLGTDGAMAIGWRQIGSYWYYFWSGGSMATGWQYLTYASDEAWFYFYSSGRMATSGWSENIYDIDGNVAGKKIIHISSNGVWNYTTSVLNWTLLDSTKHLDYAGSSVFSNYFHTAKDKWNAYKAGVVRFAMQSSAVDVVIVDDSYMKYRGLTSPSGTISINPNLVSLRSSEYSTTLKTCMHEMGHALGLGDNDSADVMYGTKSSTTTLTTNDKRSYDISYNR